jgi:hypothetical protein
MPKKTQKGLQNVARKKLMVVPANQRDSLARWLGSAGLFAQKGTLLNTSTLNKLLSLHIIFLYS